MVYLFVLAFCTFYFYGVRGFKVNSLLLLPPFMVYFLIAALQYDVGSDYFSYIHIYENQWVLERYFQSGEYFFYYVNVVLDYFRAPAQLVFFVFAFIQSLFVFIYMRVLEKKGYVLWIFFLIFFVVSSIYHNQLNGIRQYAALTFLPLLTVLLCERKYFFYLFGCLIATTLHSSAALFFLFPLFFLVDKLAGKHVFSLFLATLPVYIFVGKYTPFFISNFGVGYSSYMESEYFAGGGYVLIVTKLYYVPAILFFYLVYSEKKCTSLGIVDSKYYSFLILIFSCTYWSFLMSLDIAILSRIASYFWFFTIFPLYYVLLYLRRTNKIAFLVYVAYMLFPYMAKVTFLAKNEYLYKSYLFN